MVKEREIITLDLEHSSKAFETLLVLGNLRIRLEKGRVGYTHGDHRRGIDRISLPLNLGLHSFQTLLLSFLSFQGYDI